MTSSLLVPATISADKSRQIQDARDMYEQILRISKGSPPPYDFLELIGKGASGRVYKCRKQSNGELVAVKIVNVDDVDYGERSCDREETLKSFRKEVAVLQQLKDSNAQNVNMIHEAFDLHDQLWIVSDYCTGGSVRTLLRATPPGQRGLEEHFIIVILRELVIALKSVHDLGVMHRDIKCTNIYITEEGRIQLGDFGVVGIFDDGQSKRRTVIGTPHYMAQEMHDAQFPDSAGYDTSADIWSLGCTVYEMATGLPPNAKVSNIEQLKSANAAQPPRLEDDNYSSALKDFIAVCCQLEAHDRPSIGELLKHEYISGTAKKYPTSSLVQLIERYKLWELKGGNRVSLWAGGGAAAPPSAADYIAGDDESLEWNFSTSETFDQRFSRRYSQMIATQDFANGGTGGISPLNTQGMGSIQQYYRDISASRGEQSLQRLWRPGDEYTFDEPRDDIDFGASDLPFRNIAGSAPTRESLIDLDSAGPSDNEGPTFNFDFDDVPTIRARASRLHENADDDEEEDYEYPPYGTDERRATLDWTFPGTEPANANRATMQWQFPRDPVQNNNRSTMQWTFPAEGRSDDTASQNEDDLRMSASGRDLNNAFHAPTLRHAPTEPLDSFTDFRHPSQAFMLSSSSPIRDSIRSMIDLDAGLADPSDLVRPRTADSIAGTELSNQFDLEEDTSPANNRMSYHRPWDSEGGSMRRSSHPSVPMHSRGNSLTSSDSEMSRMTPDGSFGFTNFDYAKTHEPRSAIDQYGTEHWSSFSSDSATEDNHNFPTIRARQDSLPQRSFTSYAPTTRAINGSIEMPVPEPPHPDALVEDADHRIFLGEFSRLLEDCAVSIQGLASGLTLFSGSEEPAPTRPRFDSSAISTDDEDGS